MKTVNTLRGLKNIDVSAKKVENNEGDMVGYTDIVMRQIEGEQYFLYVTSSNTATALTLDGHRKANEISEEQKGKNLKQQAVAYVMSEGRGDY